MINQKFDLLKFSVEKLQFRNGKINQIHALDTFTLFHYGPWAKLCNFAWAEIRILIFPLSIFFISLIECFFFFTEIPRCKTVEST